MRSRSTALLVMIVVTLVGCSGPTGSSIASATTLPAQPLLTSDPALLAGDLTADEQALRDPSSSEAALLAAAHRQQVAYRALGRHPEWDAIVQPGIPPSLRETYDRNVDARRQLTALSQGEAKESPPAWPIRGWERTTPPRFIRRITRATETPS